MIVLMASIEASLQDVPAPCARCGVTTLHRRGIDGGFHCMPCLMGAMQPRLAPMERPAFGPQPHRQAIEITHRGPPLADQARNAVVFVILLFVIIGVWTHACSG